MSLLAAGDARRNSSGQARECSPKKKEGYPCIIKEKKGEGRRPPSSLPPWADTRLSFSFDPIRSKQDCHA